METSASLPSARPLEISLSFKNAQSKDLERFFSARLRFETPEAERAELHRIFHMFDADRDGKLSVDEIRSSMEKLGISVAPEDIAALLASGGRDGFLDFPDFCEFYRSLGEEEEEEEEEAAAEGDGKEAKEKGAVILTKTGKVLRRDLRSAFDLFDENHDNYISATELQSVLIRLGFKEAYSLDHCRSMIARVDSDGDGVVSFDEFSLMMTSLDDAEGNSNHH